MQFVLGHPAQAKGRDIGTSNDDRSGFAQIADDRIVGRRDAVLEGDDAGAVGHAGLIGVKFGGDRHTMQRSERTAFTDGLIRFVGMFKCFVAQDQGERVECRIHLINACQTGRHGLAA